MLFLIIALQWTAKNAKARNHEKLEMKEKATRTLMAKQKKTLEVAALETKGHDLAIAVKQPYLVVNPIPCAISLPLCYNLEHVSLSPDTIDIGCFILSLSNFEPPGVAELSSAPVCPESL